MVNDTYCSYPKKDMFPKFVPQEVDFDKNAKIKQHIKPSKKMEDDIENALKKIVIFDPKNLNQMFVFDKFNFDIKIQIIPKPQKDQIIKDKNFQEEDILI